MNIYAHNSTLERACLWLSLSEYASLADCWLVGGVFNMIEDAFDRIGCMLRDQAQLGALS